MSRTPTRPEKAGRRLPRGFALGFILGLAAAGCAGPALHDGVFKNDNVRYRTSPPPAPWSRINVPDGQVTYVLGSTGATLSAHGECRRTDAPLRALTLHILNGFTDRRGSTEQFFTFAGREALRTALSARLDGVDLRLQIVVVKRDACVFDFVYSAPPEQFAARAGDFDHFIAGFEKLPLTETR